MKTRRRQVRDRIRRNRWRRRRRWYDVSLIELRVDGVLVMTTACVQERFAEVLAEVMEGVQVVQRERAELNAGDWQVGPEP